MQRSNIQWSLEIIVSVYNIKMTVDEFKKGVYSNITLKNEPWAKDLLTFDVGLIMVPLEKGAYEFGNTVDLYSIYFNKARYNERTPYRLPNGLRIKSAAQATKLFGPCRQSVMFGASGAEVCLTMATAV